ncbi:Cation efflux system protein CusA [Raoultella terrigena]|uniref:Cation efflux system protein CusA n=1 Tax=Raoultella terrigena TaxID=577 RepID=A0A4U9D828_RAOTE|nr:Cation efflux system protein CusA [Raoultella terrigena]
MTVAVIIAGLLPILWGTGAGSEVMSRIAAPMIGGMITAPLLSLFIIPAAYKLMWLYRHRRPAQRGITWRRAGRIAIRPARALCQEALAR